MSDDLTKRIQELEKIVRQKRNAAQAGLFLSVIVVVLTAGWLYLYGTMNSSPKAGDGQIVVSSDSIRNLTYSLKEQLNEIEYQKTEIEGLKTQLDALLSDSSDVNKPEGGKEGAMVEPPKSNVKEKTVEAANVASNAEYHVVKPGESLWSIAVEHFGDGYKSRDLVAVNNISDANQILVGETLLLK